MPRLRLRTYDQRSALCVSEQIIGRDVAAWFDAWSINTCPPASIERLPSFVHAFVPNNGGYVLRGMNGTFYRRINTKSWEKTELNSVVTQAGYPNIGPIICPDRGYLALGHLMGISFDFVDFEGNRPPDQDIW